MRGPTAGTALFALALLTAHGPGGRVNRLPGFAGTTDGVCSGLATALELDQMLAAYEGGPPTTQAADPVAVSGSIRGRCGWMQGRKDASPRSIRSTCVWFISPYSFTHT